MSAASRSRNCIRTRNHVFVYGRRRCIILGSKQELWESFECSEPVGERDASAGGLSRHSGFARVELVDGRKRAE